VKSNVHVIAEAGTNHGGNLEVAKQLVDIAIAAGANSVKFQMIYPEGLYLPKFFQDGQYVDNEVFQKRAASMLSDNDYRHLGLYCQAQEIGFSASVFDRRGLDLLDELGASYIKIASCDLNHSRLLIEAAERGKLLILSTGMATLGEIDRAVTDIVATGNTNIVLMHCVSVYPCPTEKMNLSFLKTLQQAFGFPVGLSDHTENSLASAIAISMGVTWIEKHFTYDRTAEGFDHVYAMEPEAFTDFICDLRSAEAACHKPDKKLGIDETIVKGRARRALYAARDLSIGEVLTESDVLIVRPEGSLTPNDLPLVLGKSVKQPIHHYQPLSLDHFC
jgi:sialic acid synthase SpsE